MTSVLIAVAARYVANTSPLFFDHPHPNNDTNQPVQKVTSPNTVIDPDDDRTAHDKRRNDTHETAVSSNEPRAVILDLEHGIHTAKLILSVREAVLRRWEETALARKLLKYRYSNQRMGRCDRNNHDDYADDEIDAVEEQRHIERVMASCLERIHIVQPRDYTYLSLVATIESLNKRLEDDRLLH